MVRKSRLCQKDSFSYSYGWAEDVWIFKAEDIST